jgi:hypothetical protein
VVLALCAAAVVAGMCSFTASAGWVVDVPAELLAQLYGQRAESPSKATIWRVVTGADPAVVDAVIGAWLAQQSAAQESAAAEPTADSCTLVAMAVDGKTVRGATDSEGNRVHLLAAATHQDALVLGQVEVGAKTGEIPMFAPLLDTLANAGVDLSRAVITADALHTQRAHAEYLHQRGAEFVLTAKRNQPGLFTALDALAWSEVPIAARDVDTGHGRITTRTIQVLPAPPNLPFPHVNQVWLIERYTCDPAGEPLSAVAALGVTSLSAERAGPLQRPHPIRAPRDGRATQPRHRSTAADRTARHHRINPLGSRDMHRPFKILKLT